MKHERSGKIIIALLAIGLGAALRLWFIHSWPVVEGDPLIYGDIAKNWLQHGIYGLSTGAQAVTGVAPTSASLTGISPTLIRLPGYPLFLALCFQLFGVEHYTAVMYVQLFIDLASCVLIASFVHRICAPQFGVRFANWAAMIALWIGALCPFLANYVAAPLTETLSVFCVALALDSLARMLQKSTTAKLLLLALALSYEALLRPDGALLAVVLCPAIALYGRREWGWPRALRLAALCGLLAVLPFVPWTIRNERTFHTFEPLAPRYAVDPGESPTPGFNRWMRTWCIEFTSTYEVYWNANTDKLDIADLPQRAFDSPQQQQATVALFNDYNQTTTVSPDIDARFAALAADRIHHHLIRYYIGLPLIRAADMWMRPRTENLPIDLRWWQYRSHPSQTLFSWAYAALNLVLLLAALAGLLRWPRLSGAMLAFVLLRSLLLATLEAPEPRYTLECLPIVITLAAVALARIQRPMHPLPPSSKPWDGQSTTRPA